MSFSVIMPLFNKAPYIRRALESVLGQTFKDFEVIVVDDGSTDGSYNKAKEVLEGSGIDYQLIRQDNSGVSTARNNGVKASRGYYVCFLDADDWWTPDFLEKMDGLITSFPDAGIYGTNYYYVKNGRQSVSVTTASTGYINYCKVYAEKLEMPLWTGAVCLPRAVFDEMGGFKPQLKLGEDFDLWIRIALKYKVAFLNEPLAYYFQDADPAWRLVGRLHDPRNHMLWNLEYLAQEEKTNPDYKLLIDNLRTYSLLPYYLSSQYHDAAREELDKVDWSRQPEKVRSRYRKPVFILKCHRAFMKCGSAVKQWIIKHI